MARGEKGEGRLSGTKKAISLNEIAFLFLDEWISPRWFKIFLAFLAKVITLLT